MLHIVRKQEECAFAAENTKCRRALLAGVYLVELVDLIHVDNVATLRWSKETGGRVLPVPLATGLIAEPAGFCLLISTMM
jgi:hypothetical protein